MTTMIVQDELWAKSIRLTAVGVPDDTTNGEKSVILPIVTEYCGEKLVSQSFTMCEPAGSQVLPLKRNALNVLQSRPFNSAGSKTNAALILMLLVTVGFISKQRPMVVLPVVQLD